MNDHTEMAWPSVGRLASMTSQSDSTVRRSLQLLCDKKFLIQNGFSQVGTYRYLISLEGVSEIQGGVSGTGGCQRDTLSERQGGVSEVPHPPVRVTPEVNKKTKKNKYRRFVPPTLEECRAYAKDKCLSIDPVFFHEYFTEGEWIDSEGKPVKSWKQKMLSWSRRKQSQAPQKSQEPAI